MKRLLIAGLMAYAVAAHGDTFKADEGFSITLPDGWVKIPGNALQYLKKQLTEKYPELPPVMFDYGYRLNSSTGQETAPYILVQFKPVDPAVLDQIGQSEGLKSYLERGFAQAMGSFSGQASNATIGEPIYDAENDMLWATLSMDVTGAGTMKSLVGVKRTKIGLIQLNGYASADVFDAYESSFKKSFSEISIDEEIRYQPAAPSQFQPVEHGIRQSTGKTCALAALFGGVLWLMQIMLARGIRLLARARNWSDETSVSTT